MDTTAEIGKAEPGVAEPGSIAEGAEEAPVQPFSGGRAIFKLIRRWF
jgi:hypothetical protein